ncbi:MAG: chromate efflux transporter [Pseudomonadota bacterium]
MQTTGADGRPWPGYREAFMVWARIALLSFGGPAGQIALMHRILVEEKRWLGEARFLHALNFCMLLPGPEAQQLAVYVGWLMHRTWGGLMAGILFIVPGAVVILILSWIYALYGEVGVIAGLFFGLKAAVLAIVLQALVRIGKKALKNAALIVLAAGSFVAIFFFAVPFPLIIIAAGLTGFFAGRAGVREFQTGGGHAPGGAVRIDDADTLLGTETPDRVQGDIRRSLLISAMLLVVWLLPVVALVTVLGRGTVFADIAVFFSQMAVVTFGGAYAVLAYVAQAAVENFGWLRPGEMLDGLGMAETTPGPLILVTQFVGFMGAFRDPGMMPPLLAGTLGALLTIWVTFVPCFLWIFAGAPYIERLRHNRALSSALTAITAAVVGVILNLAVWFAIHVVFRDVETITGFGLKLSIPDPGSIDVVAAILSIAALVAAFRFGLGLMPLILCAALAGIGLDLAGLIAT